MKNHRTAPLVQAIPSLMQPWMTPLVNQQFLRFGAEYIAYLLGYSDCAAELGKFEEALTVADDAIRAVQRLGRKQRRRDCYLEGKCHANRFNLLFRLQRFSEAEQAIRAAVRALSRLSETHPESAVEQARCLRNLAEVQRMNCGSDKAAKTVQTARRVLDRLLGESRVPTEARRLLEAQCRTTLATCLEEAGDISGAIREDEASLAIRRDLYAGSATVHRPDLAYGLQQAARRWLKAGRLEPAAKAATECIGHYEMIGATGDQQTAAFHADALHVLADTQAAAGDVPMAVQKLVQGIHLLRPRYAIAPDLWLASLLPLCTRYVELCGQGGGDFDSTFVEDVIIHAMRSGVGT